MDAFLSAFIKNLLLARKKYPDQYKWASEVTTIDVIRRSSESFRNGTYSRHCHAVKWTCKELGIACTRAAIDKIFKESQDTNGTTPGGSQNEAA